MESHGGGMGTSVCAGALWGTGLDEGVTRVLLLLRSHLCAFMEDRNRDVARSQDGMLHFSDKGFGWLLSAWFW